MGRCDGDGGTVTNQALSALLFLCRDVLEMDLPKLNGRYAGCLLLAEQLHLETPCTLRLLRRIVMLTGDRSAVAEAIAAGLGVDALHAGQTPADKLAVI